MRCGPSWKISPILATAVAEFGLKRPLLQPLSGVAKNDMVDFGRREPSDFDRRVEQDQFFKLDLQRVEVPLALFRETIDREPEHALFFQAQVSDADARKPIKAQLLGGFVADFAVDDLVVATHKERNAKAQGADRRSNLPNMSGIKFADFSRRKAEALRAEYRKAPVGAGCHCAAGGRSKPWPVAPLLVTAVTALFAQLVGKRGPRQEFVRSISDHLHCQNQKQNQCAFRPQARNDRFAPIVPSYGF